MEFSCSSKWPWRLGLSPLDPQSLCSFEQHPPLSQSTLGTRRLRSGTSQSGPGPPMRHGRGREKVWRSSEDPSGSGRCGYGIVGKSSTTMVSSNSRETLHFRDFALDVAGYQLRRNGRPVRLERQPMDLLILLVERRLQLVSRSEIVDRLWGKDVNVDVETGVNTAIRKIRQALHDSPEAPVFVETVSGKGYRFIVPVEVVPASPDPPAAQAPENTVAVPSSSVPMVTAARRAPMARPGRAGAVLIACVAAPRRRRTLALCGCGRTRTTGAVSELLFKGDFYRGTWGEAEMRKGIDYYNRAIALDPNAVDGYVGLASAWTLLSDLHVSPRDAMPRARAAAEQVLRRDEARADAHISLGVIKLQYRLGLRRRRPGVRAGDGARAGLALWSRLPRLATDGGGTTARRAGRLAARRRRVSGARDHTSGAWASRSISRANTTRPSSSIAGPSRWSRGRIGRTCRSAGRTNVRAVWPTPSKSSKRPGGCSTRRRSSRRSCTRRPPPVAASRRRPR